MTERLKNSLPVALHDAAQARYLRRCQLWRASRLAVPDHETWRAAWVSIEDAISAQLEREFA